MEDCGANTLRLIGGVVEGRGRFLLIETSFMEEVPVASVCVWESVIIEVSVPDRCLSKLVDGYTYLLTVINDLLIIAVQRLSYISVLGVKEITKCKNNS